MKATALWWWIDRWLKSTAYTDMTLEEQGAFRNLLDATALRGGALPNDERILGKACGDALAWARLRDVVMARFVLTPGGWRNETLDSVMAESARRATKQRSYRERGNGTGNVGGNGRGPQARPPVPVPVPVPVPDQGPDKIKSTGAARRPTRPREPETGTFGLYCVVMREARATSLREDRTDDYTNVAEIFKRLCATRGLVYDSDLAGRVLEAVMAAP